MNIKDYNRPYWPNISKKRYKGVLRLEKVPRINLNRIKKLVQRDRIIFSYHGKERAVQRRISTEQTKCALLCGELIETFDDDKPCPKAHILGIIDDIPYHIIVAQCRDNLVIVTVYISEDDN